MVRVFCTQCGSKLRAGATYCGHCGEKARQANIVSKKPNKNVVHETNRSRNHKKSLTLLSVAVVVLLLLLASPAVAAWHFVRGELTSDSGIVDIANNSGFSFKGKVEFYKASPELVSADILNIHCPNEVPNTIEYGCYRSDRNKIYILDSGYPELDDVEYSTAAHEMLHSVFEHEKVPDSVRTEISSFYAESTVQSALELRETLKSYPADANLVADELHSFVGTISPLDTSDAIDQYYSQFFTDRSVPASKERAFKSKLEAKMADINAQRRALEAKSAEIDAYKAEWLDKIEAYLPINSYYGDTERYNQNVDAYNHNLEIYNKKVDDYKVRRLAFNSSVDEFNKLLRAFRPNDVQLNGI